MNKIPKELDSKKKSRMDKILIYRLFSDNHFAQNFLNQPLAHKLIKCQLTIKQVKIAVRLLDQRKKVIKNGQYID